jgi:MoxR-like ATPase
VPESGDWRIYLGSGVPHDGARHLPPPPPWRTFTGSAGEQRRSQALTYQISSQALDLVNAALYLRRPLLVTGMPGSGKSSLADSVAHELELGPVLRWHITSRSTLRDGLYGYDAISRLQDASLRNAFDNGPPDIGNYVMLGPLGTALLPRETPRVLLIDELDKSDIDFPGDLLNILEEGEFVIPELARQASTVARVRTSDNELAEIVNGIVSCRAFPFIVITSNGEREFSPAFIRRCVHLEIPPPTSEEIMTIVEAHLGPEAVRSAEEIIQRFLERRTYGTVAIDQLLNAVYLTYALPQDSDMRELVDTVIRTLSSEDI